MVLGFSNKKETLLPYYLVMCQTFHLVKYIGLLMLLYSGCNKQRLSTE